MSSFREKAQVFVIGLSIGLLTAGAFFIFKLDDYFKELNLYRKVSQTFSSQPSVSETTEKTSDPDKPEKKQSVKSQKNKTVNPADSSLVKTEKGDQASPDTLKVKTNDTLNYMMAADDIVIRKDELLATKTLEINNVSPAATKTTGKDSLLQKVSGIKEDKSNGKQMVNIELWTSPLNYKGYRMSKYKMVLYGVPSMDGIKLYRLDDVIYMKLASAVYRLDYASDFKPYERITDEQVINKLK